MHEIVADTDGLSMVFSLLVAGLPPSEPIHSYRYADYNKLMALARSDRPIEALIIEERDVWHMSKWVGITC